MNINLFVIFYYFQPHDIFSENLKLMNMKTRMLLLKNVLFTIAMSLVAFSYSPGAKNGNTCKTAKTGNREWMSENLNVSTFHNGDPIPQAIREQDFLFVV
jgi:hypothetical protein